MLGLNGSTKLCHIVFWSDLTEPLGCVDSMRLGIFKMLSAPSHTPHQLCSFLCCFITKRGQPYTLLKLCTAAQHVALNMDTFNNYVYKPPIAFDGA